METTIGQENLSICIALFFRSPFGGLHENVLATVRFLTGQGCRVTVFCSPGPFVKKLEAEDATVIETDFEQINAVVRIAEQLKPFDLVHVHPGPSQEFGLRLARRNEVPAVITIHGAWLDNLHLFHERYERVFVVSEAIRDRIENEIPAAARKTVLMRNATSISSRIERSRSTLANGFRVLVASRLDKDKEKVLEFLKGLWEQQQSDHNNQIYWEIAGDGSELEGLQKASQNLCDESGNPLVHFHGWLDYEQLRKLWNRVDASVSPGRSAIETLAQGIPTVALGSQGCVGLITPDRASTACYNNLGGYGLTEPVSEKEAYHELVALKTDLAFQSTLSLWGRNFVDQEFSQQVWDERMMRVYREILKTD